MAARQIKRPLPEDPAELRAFQEEFNIFGCQVHQTNPKTPDRVEPHIKIDRVFFSNGQLAMPDGNKVIIWGFLDPAADPPDQTPFPSAPIRVVEGRIVHNTAHIGKNNHTIHHHGIEPTPFNDGVGHTSFEITGNYTYQWQAAHSGTYFYHCHRNTPLHFEMGMAGLLIIDPPKPEGAEGPEGPYPMGGPGFVRRMNQIVPYDVEAFLLADEIDPRWHTLQHRAGQCGEDVGLNNFLPREPRYFLINAVPDPLTETDPRVVIKAKAGQTILVRCLNEGYTVQTTRLGLDAEVIASDGRTFGSELSPYSQPFFVAAGEPFTISTAQRYDMLIKPTRAGTFPVEIDFQHWIRGKALGEVLKTVKTSIEVS